MSSLLKSCALYAWVLAGLSASAMPVGVQLAMRGRAAAQAAVDATFPKLATTATAGQVEAALSTAADNALADNIVHIQNIRRHIKGHDIAGIIPVKEEHSRSCLHLSCDICDLLRGRRLKNASDAAAVDKSLSHIPEEQRKVSRSAACNDRHLYVLFI